MSKNQSTWEWEKQGRYIRWRQVVATDQWEVDKHWYHLFGFLWLRGRPAMEIGEVYYDLSSSFPDAMSSSLDAMSLALKEPVLVDEK